jgi:8-oxo-dGTP diphosphatase
MQTELKIHKYQKEILTKLHIVLSHRFNELLIDGVASEHMNYHLKKLIDLGLVKKFEDNYSLTDKGKDYTNSLDDETKIVEKQPKTSIVIYGVRKNENTGEIEFLLNRRLEHPYFGKVGRMGGKVRFGEKITDAAKRELLEETGLTAKSFTLERIYRKMRQRENGEFVQDVVFYIFFVKDFFGTLIEKTPTQENFWASKKELENKDKYDTYDDLVLDEKLEPKPLIFDEVVKMAEGY